MVSLYAYTIEYYKITDHGNADELNQFSAGKDPDFDGEEEERILV